MTKKTELACTAFHGERRLVNGPLAEVAVALMREPLGEDDVVLVFDDASGRLVDLDLRGSEDEVRERYLPATGAEEGSSGSEGPARPRRSRGRPKLGVVSHEVTLLPRHWAWLRAQRGGASATLRRLVDQARKDGAHADVVRSSQDAAYRFMSGMLGDHPGFEEAIRALFAGDRDKLEAESEAWPPDLREYGLRLAEGAFSGEESES